jgi:hypothetical protein
MKMDVDSSDAHERIVEIGEILAAGLMRLAAPKSSPESADGGESLLDFSPDRSGHPTLMKRGKTDG